MAILLYYVEDKNTGGVVVASEAQLYLWAAGFLTFSEVVISFLHHQVAPKTQDYVHDAVVVVLLIIGFTVPFVDTGINSLKLSYSEVSDCQKEGKCTDGQHSTLVVTMIFSSLLIVSAAVHCWRAWKNKRNDGFDKMLHVLRLFSETWLLIEFVSIASGTSLVGKDGFILILTAVLLSLSRQVPSVIALSFGDREIDKVGIHDSHVLLATVFLCVGSFTTYGSGADFALISSKGHTFSNTLFGLAITAVIMFAINLIGSITHLYQRTPSTSLAASSGLEDNRGLLPADPNLMEKGGVQGQGFRPSAVGEKMSF